MREPPVQNSPARPLPLSERVAARIARAQGCRNLIEQGPATGPRELCCRVGCQSTTCADRLAREDHDHCTRLVAYQYWRYLRDTAGIPDRYINATFENAEAEFRILDIPGRGNFFEKARAYVMSYEKNLTEGTNIFMTGPLSGGKTYLASAIANALCDRGVPVLWRTAQTFASEFMMTLGGGGNLSIAQFRERFWNVPFLVLDEWSAEYGTDIVRAELPNLINERYNRRRATCVTCNLDKDARDLLPNDYKRCLARLEDRAELYQGVGAGQSYRTRGRRA